MIIDKLIPAANGSIFNVTHLPNGVTLVMEKVPGVRTVATGIWVNRGSRHETPNQAGITHFTEHMLFKGSQSRTAYDLARSMDILGGHFDAGTSKEFLCIISKYLDENVPAAMDLLAELLINPRFPEEEIEKERQVILDEISLYMDDPEEQLLEMLYDLCWNGNTLCKPILGDKEVISSITREEFRSFHDELINPEDLFIIAAGNLDFNQIHTQALQYFGQLKRKAAKPEMDHPQFKSGIQTINRPVEQTYFAIGIPWLPVNSPERYCGYLINTILGGNMSSLLFQRLRENHGLTYNIGSYESTFTDSGLLVIFGSTQKKLVKKCLELIWECLNDLILEKINDKQLNEAKICLKNNIAMSFEGSSQRMSTLAKQHAYNGKRITADESLASIESVSLSDFNSLCQQCFNNNHKSLILQGPGQRNHSWSDPFSEKYIKKLK